MKSWRVRLTSAGLCGVALMFLAGCPIFSLQEAQRNVPVSQTLDGQVLVRSATPIGGMALAPDGRIFYTEKNTGALRVIVNDVLVAAPVATVPVNSAGARGMLGVAVHPRVDQNGRVYVFYSRSDTGQSTRDPQAIVDHRIVYFQVANDLALSNEIFVVSLPAFGTRQVGGRLAFGEDQRLLVGMGDNEDVDAVQEPGFLSGKILRYNDDGAIPDGNIAPGSPVLALGVRDPRGFATDPVSGTTYFVDRSPGNSSEVNRLERAGNYGWPEVFGPAGEPGLIDPILDSGLAAAAWSGIGFNFALRYGPAQYNTLLVGESSTNQLRLAELSADLARVTNVQVIATGLPGEVIDLAFSESGTLYIACSNAILRVRQFP